MVSPPRPRRGERRTSPQKEKAYSLPKRRKARVRHGGREGSSTSSTPSGGGGGSRPGLILNGGEKKDLLLVKRVRPASVLVWVEEGGAVVLERERKGAALCRGGPDAAAACACLREAGRVDSRKKKLINPGEKIEITVYPRGEKGRRDAPGQLTSEGGWSVLKKEKNELSLLFSVKSSLFFLDRKKLPRLPREGRTKHVSFSSKKKDCSPYLVGRRELPPSFFPSGKEGSLPKESFLPPRMEGERAPSARRRRNAASLLLRGDGE